MSESPVGVIYLAREADGLHAFQRFARSYVRFQGGMPHELIVLFKGFTTRDSLEAGRRALGGLQHIPIELADVGFDIGAYLDASRRVGHEYLAFLNTHSEIAAPDWLKYLYQYASMRGVGVAGAMGSYESIRNTVLLLRNAIWESVGVGKHYDRWLAYYFDFVLSQYHSGWYGPAGEVREPVQGGLDLLRRMLKSAARARRRAWFENGGTALIWRGSPAFDHMQFPAFPNPHIRSNAFMMRRERFLQFDLPTTPAKFDTSLFESGPDSMTAHIRKAGLRTVVVGADGEGHDLESWWRSGTFRLGDQRNLLVCDNHTRAYAAMSQGARLTHARMTWGDFIGAPPPNFPDLGVQFSKSEIKALALG